MGLRGLGLSGLLSLASGNQTPWSRCLEPGLQLVTVYTKEYTLGKNWVMLGEKWGPSLVMEAHMQVHQKGWGLALSPASQKINKRSKIILHISCHTHQPPVVYTFNFQVFLSSRYRENPP